MSLLNAETLSKVKKLCNNNCANLIAGKCILTGATCDYFSKTGKDASCDWFEEAVLPNDKALQEAYQEQHGITYLESSIGKYNRTCKACDMRFKTDSKNKLTCSDQCNKELRKATNSAYYLRQS